MPRPDGSGATRPRCSGRPSRTSWMSSTRSSSCSVAASRERAPSSSTRFARSVWSSRCGRPRVPRTSCLRVSARTSGSSRPLRWRSSAGRPAWRSRHRDRRRSRRHGRGIAPGRARRASIRPGLARSAPADARGPRDPDLRGLHGQRSRLHVRERRQRGGRAASRRGADRSLPAEPSGAAGGVPGRRPVGRHLHRQRLRLRRGVRPPSRRAGPTRRRRHRVHDEWPVGERRGRARGRTIRRGDDGPVLGRGWRRGRGTGRYRAPRAVVDDGPGPGGPPPAPAPVERGGRSMGRRGDAGRRRGGRRRAVTAEASRTEDRPVLHLIGNSHIDPVWLWQWPEGYQEIRATFRSALDRMNEYPEFIFTCDSVAYYEWIAEIDPAMFEEIRQRVAEGRWELVGGWWVEPDCNLPGGESFVRQALVGQRFFLREFGKIATVGYNVDPFGHNAMLPQLLHRSGMDSYVFMRPGPHELALPAPLFWWESADGSRVLAYRLPHEYCAPREDLGNHLDKSIAQLPERWAEMMAFYGVGNHGGGPTRENLDSIRRLNGVGAMPSLRHSTPAAFFET